MADTEAVLFDFDGVLAESSEIKVQAFAELYREHGPEVVEAVVAHHLAHEGISRITKIRHCHKTLLGIDLIDDALAELGARFQPRDEAEAALDAARGQGGDVANAERNLATARYYEDARTLAHRLTEWSRGLEKRRKRFVVCTGGGPGIMEAANRGASEAKGLNVGLGISLPQEPSGNPYSTRQLSFEFHYFFMRKFWFVYLAKALVAFPGGFGTLDEFFEVMTLLQTGKLKKRMPIVLFGSEFWNDVLNLDALVRFGTIDRADLDLFRVSDTVDDAFDFITTELSADAIDQPGGRW